MKGDIIIQMSKILLTNKEIGERIKLRRKELDMTLKEIAEKANVAESTIQRYETGQINKIKLPVIESIAKAIKVNPEWLVEENARKEIICGFGFDEITGPFLLKGLQDKAKGKIPLEAKVDALYISDNEQDTLIYFRALDKNGKISAQSIMEYLNQLNPKGIAEAERHTKYLTTQDEYKKNNTKSSTKTIKLKTAEEITSSRLAAFGGMVEDENLRKKLIDQAEKERQKNKPE